MLCLGAPRLEANDLQELDAQQFGARFKVASKLGQGAFADVLCVKDAARSQQLAALKVLKPVPAPLPPGLAVPGALVQRASSFNSPGAQAPEVSLFREARALKHSKHPNVVELHSVVHIPKACVTDASTSRSKRANTGHCWGILIELLQGGSLQQQVYKVMSQPHSAAYSYVDALTWACDIASAVAHLHGLNPVVIHRDLKLENILLRKPPTQGPPGCRKLPIAKLTDFGLHVMIDRPPAPFFITTGEDGMPLLILQPDSENQQQQQQQQQQETAQQQAQQEDSTMPASQQLTVDAVASAGDQGTPSSSNTSTPDAFAIADAEARVAPAGSKSSATSKPSFTSALKGTHNHHHHHHQQQQQPKQVAFALEASAADAATADDADAAAAAATATSAPLTSTGPGAGAQHTHLQRQSPQVSTSADALGTSPGQWKRLTAGTLRRLSVDSWSNTSGSLSCPAAGSAAGSRVRRISMEQRAIPLMLQPPAVGQSGSFVNAAVPEQVLTAAEGQAAAGPAAAVMTVASPRHSRSSSGSGSGAPESAMSGGGVEVIGGGSISSILAAANSQKDYEVTFRPASLKSSHLAAHRKQGAGSNPYARSSQQSDTGPAGPPGSQGAGEDDRVTNGTPSECGMSARSGEWPTAASMMWEDLMEDEVEQQLLLDGGVPAVGTTHGGPLIELPLSYNLTGHTGSFMYMAPEVYKRKPYNESVDVFSMGVMLYELFSRTLLIYTHTPANKPDDCEHYAARISDGYRPKRVRAMTDEVWELIEACWHQDPSARPAARDVLLRLQRLLAQAQAADAAKGPKGFGKLFGRASQEQAAAAAPVASGGTAGQGSTALQAASADPAAQSLAGMPPQKVGVEIAGGPGREAHARAEPACGCVIC